MNKRQIKKNNSWKYNQRQGVLAIKCLYEILEEEGSSFKKPIRIRKIMDIKNK